MTVIGRDRAAAGLVAKSRRAWYCPRCPPPPVSSRPRRTGPRESLPRRKGRGCGGRSAAGLAEYLASGAAGQPGGRQAGGEQLGPGWRPWQPERGLRDRGAERRVHAPRHLAKVAGWAPSVPSPVAAGRLTAASGRSASPFPGARSRCGTRRRVLRDLGDRSLRQPDSGVPAPGVDRTGSGYLQRRLAQVRGRAFQSLSVTYRRSTSAPAASMSERSAASAQRASVASSPAVSSPPAIRQV